MPRIPGNTANDLICERFTFGQSGLNEDAHMGLKLPFDVGHKGRQRMLWRFRFVYFGWVRLLVHMQHNCISTIRNFNFPSQISRSSRSSSRLVPTLRSSCRHSLEPSLDKIIPIYAYKDAKHIYKKINIYSDIRE